MVHETVAPRLTLRTLAESLRPGGQLLLLEPAGHCPPALWLDECATAAQVGLLRVPHPRLEGKKMLALWRKP